jgi:hypothetical protein
MKTSWWYESGLAAQAAQELVWFVFIVFVGIGLLAWWDMRNESPSKKTTSSKSELRNLQSKLPISGGDKYEL